jgi:AraC-like DNA-binding protein
MYFMAMFSTRQELMERFTNPVFIPHPLYLKGVRTFSCISGRQLHPVIEIAKMRLSMEYIDYLEYSPDPKERIPLQLKFQSDSFCLWYQVDGSGILQNTSRNIFGTARPGLLGIMERGIRYTYLHQKGTFECFLLAFSLLPAKTAKCYWNSEIEGKTVLEGTERGSFENNIFDLLLLLEKNSEPSGLSMVSRMIELVVVPFKKGLLAVENAQFPKNKRKSLVAKAQSFMERNYAHMRHQNDLERECGVDINYLNLIFKKETGETLYDYLVSIRLERAKHHLETTDTAVSDIARVVGYPNANSFSRAFRRRENKSPLEFKRMSRSGVLPQNHKEQP